MNSQAQTSTNAAPGKHFHVVPLRVLAAVWVLLVVLTWITVGATTVDLGNLNIAIALFIAVVKSVYVALYFMHLRYDNPFHALIFLTGLAFVVLFIGLALMDTKQYAATEIPGYAPEIGAVHSTP
jgi:cytochrome c oxidase subunit 4